MHIRRNIVIGLALLLAGCARFEHQTNESEPHGVVVVIAAPSDFPDSPVVKKLDGLAVRAGRTYRVKPGEHEVTIRMVERGVTTYKPMSVGAGHGGEQPATLNMSQSGRSEVTGMQPNSGPQPVNINMEDRSVNYLKTSFSVEAGWRYELDGGNINKARIAAPR